MTNQQIQKTVNELQTAIRSPSNLQRVASALGIDSKEKMQDAEQFLSSVLASVKNADPKTKIHQCSPDSIVDAAIDAAQMRVSVDGRKHSQIIAYYNKDKGGYEASLQINAAGYEAKLYEALEDCDLKCEAIFKDDEFGIDTLGNIDTVKHKPADPFEDDVNKLRGIYVAISYTKSGEKYCKAFRIPASELGKIKGKAKMGYVWKEWFIERAKTAAIKRAAKRFFQNSITLQRLVDYDNEKGYDVSEDQSRSSSNIIDNINKQLEAPSDDQAEVPEDNQEPIEAEVVDTEPDGEVEIEKDSLLKLANQEASKGMDAYKEFFESLSKDQKSSILDEHDELKELAYKNEPIEGDVL